MYIWTFSTVNTPSKSCTKTYALPFSALRLATHGQICVVLWDGPYKGKQYKQNRLSLNHKIKIVVNHKYPQNHTAYTPTWRFQFFKNPSWRKSMLFLIVLDLSILSKESCANVFKQSIIFQKALTRVIYSSGHSIYHYIYFSQYSLHTKIWWTRLRQLLIGKCQY